MRQVSETPPISVLMSKSMYFSTKISKVKNIEKIYNHCLQRFGSHVSISLANSEKKVEKFKLGTFCPLLIQIENT